MFDAAVSELIVQVVMAVALALVGVAAFGLKKLVAVGVSWLEVKIGVDRFAMLKTYTDTIVRALAQSPITKDLIGDAKKELAMSQISQFARSKGFDISPEDIDNLIEEAVQVMKAELGDGYLWDLFENEED